MNLKIMYGDFLGTRIKQIREEKIKLSQTELADEINDYLDKKTGNNIQKDLVFSQSKISQLEGYNSLGKDRLILLINFLYDRYKINPSYLLVERNNNHPVHATRLIMDKSLIEKQKELKEYAQKIDSTIDDIALVIDNSAFK